MACILVIESDLGFYEALGDHLYEAARHTCLQARTGVDGLALARAVHLDLVVLAWTLPDRAGLEVYRDLQHARRIPVIFVGANVREEDRVHGFLAGGTDFVVMPLSVRELALRVQAVLRRVEIGRQRAKVAPCDVHIGGAGEDNDTQRRSRGGVHGTRLRRRE